MWPLKIINILLFFCFLNEQILCENKTTKNLHEYCIIGAGPAGLQMAYFLQKSNRDYVVFEKNSYAGTFFTMYPRRRRLISLNKRNTGEINKEFNLRHDWNSLLVDQVDYYNDLKFTSYAKENFPSADYLVKYLEDFRIKFNLNVQFNTSVSNINCETIQGETSKICSFEDQNKMSYKCSKLIISTGLAKPNIFKNVDLFDGYENVSINLKDYERKTVLILGRGNSAFEIAQLIYGVTNMIHMVSRSRLRNAYSTHYVGDVRAMNSDILDTYQLKSLDGLLDIDLNEVEFKKVNDKYYMVLKGLDQGKNKIHPNSVRTGYDKIIRCLGFKFDNSIFNKTMKFSTPNGRAKKYPKINGDFQSTDYENVYFAGTLAHSLDFRKSSGGFIHGFRYNARALHKILEHRYHQVKWPFKSLKIEYLFNYVMKRINEASGLYQMFGQLIDVISIKDGKFEYFEEYPLSMLDQFEEKTGSSIESFIIVNYEYGPNFSGPGKDVFHLERAFGDAKFAFKSNFLHPVFYYFEKLSTIKNSMPKLSIEKKSKYFLEKASKIHHMIEDLLTFWNEPKDHQLYLRRFFESVLNVDLKLYKRETCLKLFKTYASAPLSCNAYFK